MVILTMGYLLTHKVIPITKTTHAVTLNTKCQMPGTRTGLEQSLQMELNKEGFQLLVFYAEQKW